MIIFDENVLPAVFVIDLFLSQTGLFFSNAEKKVNQTRICRVLPYNGRAKIKDQGVNS